MTWNNILHTHLAPGITCEIRNDAIYVFLARILNLSIDLQINIFNKVLKQFLLYGCEKFGRTRKSSTEIFKQILNLKKVYTVLYGIR